MKSKVTKQENITIIALEGSLMGGPDATSLNTQLHDLLNAKSSSIVLDLGGVDFMNSSGLGMLIGSASTVKNAGGTLKLAQASDKIIELIKITKLSPLFEHFPTVKAAAESFKK